MYEINQNLNQELVDDYAFFHSSRNNSFGKFTETLSKLKNFKTKTLLGLIPTTVLFGLFAYVISGSFSSPEPLYIGLMAISAFLWLGFRVAQFIFLFSRKKYLEVMFENKFSKHKLLKIQELLKKIATDSGKLDAYQSFVNNVQRGSLTRSNVEFYINMLERLFNANEKEELNSVNTPSGISIQMDDDSEALTQKNLTELQSLNFFEDEPSTKKANR